MPPVNDEELERLVEELRRKLANVLVAVRLLRLHNRLSKILRVLESEIEAVINLLDYLLKSKLKPKRRNGKTKPDP